MTALQFWAVEGTGESIQAQPGAQTRGPPRRVLSLLLKIQPWGNSKSAKLRALLGLAGPCTAVFVPGVDQADGAAPGRVRTNQPGGVTREAWVASADADAGSGDGQPDPAAPAAAAAIAGDDDVDADDAAASTDGEADVADVAVEDVCVETAGSPRRAAPIPAVLLPGRSDSHLELRVSAVEAEPPHFPELTPAAPAPDQAPPPQPPQPAPAPPGPGSPPGGVDGQEAQGPPAAPSSPSPAAASAPCSPSLPPSQPQRRSAAASPPRQRAPPREPLHPLWQASPRRGALSGGSVRGWMPAHLLGPSPSSFYAVSAPPCQSTPSPCPSPSPCASPSQPPDAADGPTLAPPRPRCSGSGLISPTPLAPPPHAHGPAAAAAHPLLSGGGAASGGGGGGGGPPSSRASSTHSDRPLRMASGPAVLTPSASAASLPASLAHAHVHTAALAQQGLMAPPGSLLALERDREREREVGDGLAGAPPHLGPIQGPLRGSRMQGHVTAVTNPAYAAAAAAATANAAAAIAAAIDSATPGVSAGGAAPPPLRDVSRRQRLLQSVASLAPVELELPATPPHPLLPPPQPAPPPLGGPSALRPSTSLVRESAAVAAVPPAPLARGPAPPLAAAVAAAAASASAGPVEGLQGHGIPGSGLGGPGPGPGMAAGGPAAGYPATQLLAVVDPHTLAHVQAQAAAVAAAAGLAAASTLPVPLTLPAGPASPFASGSAPAVALNGTWPGAPSAGLLPQQQAAQQPVPYPQAQPGYGHLQQRSSIAKPSSQPSPPPQPHQQQSHKQDHPHHHHHSRGSKGRHRRPSLTDFGSARAALQHRPADGWSSQAPVPATPGGEAGPASGSRPRTSAAADAGGGPQGPTEADLQAAAAASAAAAAAMYREGHGGGGGGPPLHAFHTLRHSQADMHLGPGLVAVVNASGAAASPPRRLQLMGSVGHGAAPPQAPPLAVGMGTGSGSIGGGAGGGGAPRPGSSAARASTGSLSGGGGGGAVNSTSWLTSGVSLLQALAAGGEGSSPHRPSRGALAAGVAMVPNAGGGPPFLNMGPGRMYHPQRPVGRGGRVH